MDTDKAVTTDTGAAVESKDEAESFTKVKSKKSQKRKRDQDGVDMETEGHAPLKRPQFPPISGEQLRVTMIYAYVIRLLPQYFIVILHFKVVTEVVSLNCPFKQKKTALRLRTVVL